MTEAHADRISISDLAFLAGTWKGSGRALYPTIEPMEYSEELRIDCNAFDPVLHYEQRTWVLSDGERKGQPIFWESGFLIDRGANRFDLVSAQKTGRVEILTGTVHRDGSGGITVPLQHTTIINDERVIRSGRTFTFTRHHITYELTMSTTANPTYERHLIAELHRVTPPGI
jgi:THAP4-like, heme-binding beta-barrel domain